LPHPLLQRHVYGRGKPRPYRSCSTLLGLAAGRYVGLREEVS